MRPATREDCRRIWEWRNDPVTRAASFETSPIPYQQHERWFSQKLRDSSTRLWIVLDVQGTPIGQLRFDIENQTAFISIHMAPGSRGQGYGSAAIRYGSDLLLASEPVRSIRAQIKADNAASVAAFERAGYSNAGIPKAPGSKAIELAYAPPRFPTGTRILFRTEAGPHVGLGHLQRCLSLAQGLAAVGAECRFLVNPDTSVLQRIRRFAFEASPAEFRKPWTAEDMEETADRAQAWGCSAVVVDSYSKEPEYLEGLRSKSLFSCSVEDLPYPPFACHAVINPAPNAQNLGYRSSSGDTRFLLGPQFALLRREFWNVPLQPPRERIRQILVTAGGAGRTGLLKSLLEPLASLPSDISVTVILGPFAEGVDIASGRIEIVRSPETVLDLMLAADLAVTAGGQTLYELACIGCPAVAFSAAANQDGQLASFVEAGAARHAGAVQDSDLPQKVAGALRELAENPELRARMSQAGRRLVDGQGALRAARALAESLPVLGTKGAASPSP